MEKYRLLRERLWLLVTTVPTDEKAEFLVADFCVPPEATFAELCLAHAPDYIARVESGELSAAEQKLIGFPWTPAMVARSKRSSGATIAACRTAMTEGVAANLAGGTHHAFYDRGEGFCVFNDAAIAARAMQTAGLVAKVAIIDCDVHQGNGTAAILAGDDSIFTFSMHGAKNYPFRREYPSDLDIALADGTTDDEYLAALEAGLVTIFEKISPDLIVYLAGADPFEDDRLGRLKLSKAGLLARDEMVFAACMENGMPSIPLAIVMAGGYARTITDTVDIHVATIQRANQFFNSDDQNPK